MQLQLARTAVHASTVQLCAYMYRDTYTYMRQRTLKTIIHAMRKSGFQIVLSLAFPGLACWENYLMSCDCILTNPVARILVCGI